MLTAFSAGFALSFSLILAIGAQNAFVLRQGIRRLHVGPIVAFCCASEAVLIFAGVAGFGVGQAIRVSTRGRVTAARRSGRPRTSRSARRWT